MARRSRLFWLSALFLPLLGLLLVPQVASSATKQERQQRAEALVKKALTKQSQAYHDTERRKLLEAALVEVPEYAPAMWHSGNVRFHNRWVAADEVPELVEEDRRYQAYFNVRSEYDESVAGQLELAAWCREHGLEEQERAHLTAVLSVEPDHRQARARLGFKRVDGAWLSEDEITEAAERAIALRKDLVKWRPQLNRILKGLASRSLRRQEAAKEELLAIDHPAAIPAMELTLSLRAEPVAQLMVTTLDGISGRDASLALARQAVFSPWKSVRREASYRLRGRKMESFVPALLSSIYTPVQSRAEIYRAPGGRLLYTHVFYREGQTHKQLAVMQTMYQRIARVGGDGRETLARALHMMNEQYQQRERVVAQQNARTEHLNGRIHDVLTAVSSQILPEDPAEWWDWWSEYNEVFSPGQKPTDERETRETVTLVDSGGTGGGSPGEGGGSSPPPSIPLDCLARGTQIWTARGPRPIEEIQVGDMLLSQDPDSGKLAYKPVLRTTVRPPGWMVRINAGRETISTSGGHLFWRAGRGWAKARELEEGMPVHRLDGTLSVDSVEKGDFDETFNVIVADFHTYFVGSEKILSHDNTVREPTDAVVPGLMRPDEETLFD